MTLAEGHGRTLLRVFAPLGACSPREGRGTVRALTVCRVVTISNRGEARPPPPAASSLRPDPSDTAAASIAARATTRSRSTAPAKPPTPRTPRSTREHIEGLSAARGRPGRYSTRDRAGGRLRRRRSARRAAELSGASVVRTAAFSVTRRDPGRHRARSPRLREDPPTGPRPRRRGGGPALRARHGRGLRARRDRLGQGDAPREILGGDAPPIAVPIFDQSRPPTACNYRCDPCIDWDILTPAAPAPRGDAA